MENDLVPLRRVVLLSAALALLACGLLPAVAAAAPAGASPTSLTFNQETVGKASTSQSITVSNPDPGAVQILGVSVVGTDPVDFAITAESCEGANLGEGGACAVEVAFAPTAGGSREATLEITVEGEAPITVPLAGTGQTKRLVAPASASFPATTVNAASSQHILLKNSSEAGVSLNELKIEGADPSDFGIESNNCFGFIGPSMNCEVTVRFLPGASGPREAQLHFVTDATPSDYVVDLSGEGVAPELTFEPGGYDFGLVERHSNSPRTNFTLRNTGAASVSLSNPEITGPDVNEFYLPNNNCGGSTLPPGASCSIEVQFNANEEGSASAAISINGGGVIFQAPLTGRAENPRVEGSPLTFGPTSVGSRQVQELTLTNTGHLPVAFFIALVSGGDIASFHVIEESCTSNVFAGNPRVLEPGESCAAEIAFEPTSAGAKAATVSFFGGGEGALQVPVEGEAVAPQLSLSPSSRDFGSLAVGATGPAQNFQLRNESAEPQTIDAATLTGPDLGEFQVRSDECTEAVLAPGAACAVAVRFAPGSSGPKAATLRLRGAGGGAVAQLSGEATGAPAVSSAAAGGGALSGRVTLKLNLRTRPASGRVVIGRARCASSRPCLLKVGGLVSGQIATASGRRAGVRGLAVRQLKLAPGASTTVTTVLPYGFGDPAAMATLRVFLHWQTGPERGAAARSFRLGREKS
jgi:hypothetical protein